MRIAGKLAAGSLVVLCCLMAQAADSTKKLSPKQEQLKRDQLRIAVQEICPVSGQKLGSHGKPIKVKAGKQLTVFLCCKGCLKGKINPKHWATIHGNIVKAQKICPVMKHKLSQKPKWTIIQGQLVYYCCPPCTKKLAAQPTKYLRELDKLYQKSIDARKRVAKAKRRVR